MSTYDAEIAALAKVTAEELAPKEAFIKAVADSWVNAPADAPRFLSIDLDGTVEALDPDLPF